MLKSIAVVSLLLSAAASGQVSAHRSAGQPAATTDADKIVCKKEEQIGSRLGGKKTCLTVREWEARKEADREQTERVQSGARAPCSDALATQCGPAGDPF